MSYRKIVGALVFLISILFVNLLTGMIADQSLHYLKRMHVLKATAIGMTITVFLLYPAFSYIDKWSEKLTKKMFAAGKNAAGKFIGLLMVFIIALGILFIAYLRMWFGIWIWQVSAVGSLLEFN